MKITRIKACNLASLAGVVELDLLSGPLGQAGLFAITGPTGSGKTTLLDAVCLALFDQTPRLMEADRRVKISRQGSGLEGIGARSPLSLLRHDAGSGYAEVDFEGVGGRPFTSRWEVRRAGDKPSGRLQAQKMRLIDRITQQEMGSGTKRDTLQLIEQHLGLNFEQFTRSALLAQGQFASFLKASRNTRAELLERMTGTDLYAQISVQAYNQHKASKEKLEALQTQQQALELLTPIERAQLEGQLKIQRADLNALTQQRDTRSSYTQWRKNRQAAERALQQSEETVTIAQAAWKRLLPQRTRLSRFRESAHQRTLLAALDSARSKLAEASPQAAQAQADLAESQQAHKAAQLALTQGHKALADALAEQTQQVPRIDAARALQARLAAALGAHGTAQAEHTQAASTTRRQASTLAGLRAEQATRDTALMALRSELETLQQAQALLPLWSRLEAELQELESLNAAGLHFDPTRLSAAKQKADQHAAGAKQARARRAELRLALKGLLDAPAPAATAAQAALAELQEKTLRWQDHQERLATRLAQKEAAEQALQQGEQALVSLRSRLTQHEHSLPELKRQRQRARELRALGESTLSLSAHRARLIPGEACPLCGSEEHPGVDPTQVLLDTLEADELAAMDALSEAERIQGSLQGQITRHNSALAAQREALQQARQAFDEHSESAQGLKSALGDPDTLRRRTATLRAHAEAQQQARSDWEAQCSALRAELQEADAAVDDADTALTLARETLEHTQQAATRHEQTQLRATHLRAQMAQTLAELPGFQTRDLDAPAALLQRWRSQVPLARTCLASAQQHREVLQGLEAPLARAEERLDQATRAEEQAQQRLAALSQELAQLQAQHSEMGLPDPEALHTQVAQAVQRGREALEHARTRSEDLRVKAEGAASRAAEKLRLQVQADHAVQASETALAQTLEEMALSELRDLAAWPEHARLHVEAQVSEARNQREQSLTVHRERQEALATLHGAQPALPAPDSPDQPPLDERLHRSQRRLVELEMRLDQHRGDEAQAQSLLSQIEAHRAASRKWAVLKDLIGSANGDTFRQFAQGLTLETLIGHANTHLAELAPRYRLARVPGEDLELQIIDQAMAGDVRSVNSLSGGETFLTSLALALGLASLSSSKTPVRTLFIDEGFGSLDPKSLDTALATLDALQAGGRQVGIISHVAGIGDHIGVQVRVKPIAPGKSQVLVP